MGVVEWARQQWPFSSVPISHGVRMSPGGRFIVFQSCPEGIKIDSRAWGGRGGVAAAGLGCKVLVQCRWCAGEGTLPTPSLVQLVFSGMSFRLK